MTSTIALIERFQRNLQGKQEAADYWLKRWERAEAALAEMVEILDEHRGRAELAEAQVKELREALPRLALVHMREDDLSGFVVEMGAVPSSYGPVTMSDYIEAWETVWNFTRRARALKEG